MKHDTFPMLMPIAAIALLTGLCFATAEACKTCAAHNPPATGGTPATEHGDDHEHLDAAEGFVTLLDAHHTEGWTFDMDWIKIEDGVIIAGSLEKDIPAHRYAVYEKEYYNFELRLQAKAEGPERTNGGIQIRSAYNAEKNDMAGYQADMGFRYWGLIYDQSRRNSLLTKHAEGFSIAEDIKQNDWNDYVIKCEGPRIRVWINGKLASDYTEENEEFAAKAGLIGLQMHSGPASLRYYRNIRIKELD